MGIDRIITDFGFQEDGGKLEGWPSDHPMIKGKFEIGEKSEKLRKKCCENCAGSPWCSPGSGSCYLAQDKPYYESCPVDPRPTPRPAPSTPTPIVSLEPGCY